MKTKLIGLGLSEDLVDKILGAFVIYEWSVKEYDKSKGKIAFQENMEKIEQLSGELIGKLKNITRMEKQFLNQLCDPSVFDLMTGLTMLSFSCKEAKKMDVRFSKRAPFLLDFTMELWKLLENHGVPVKTYKENMLCKVLKTLFPLPDPEHDNDVLPDDLWAFHLLREARKRLSKLNQLPS